MFFVMVLKICMWFGYSPQIIFFVTFFRKLKLSHFFQAFLLSKWIDSTYLVCATPPTVFMRILSKLLQMFFVMVWRYACGFWYSPSDFFFITFFHKFELSHFFRHFFSIKENRKWVPCVRKLLLQFLCRFFQNLIGVFCSWSWRYACGFGYSPLRFFFGHFFPQVLT